MYTSENTEVQINNRGKNQPKAYIGTYIVKAREKVNTPARFLHYADSFKASVTSLASYVHANESHSSLPLRRHNKAHRCARCQSRCASCIPSSTDANCYPSACPLSGIGCHPTLSKMACYSGPTSQIIQSHQRSPCKSSAHFAPRYPCGFTFCFGCSLSPSPKPENNQIV